MYHASLLKLDSNRPVLDLNRLHSHITKVPPLHGKPAETSVDSIRDISGVNRLKLILDLDNTLLHANGQHRVGIDIPFHGDPIYMDLLGPRPVYDLEQFPLECSPGTYYAKYRPFVREFLDDMRPFFELSIHTNAHAEYARVVCGHLEENALHKYRKETESLFADRVLARLENENGQKKDITRTFVFGGGYTDKQMVILDDRQDVWDSELKHNLIKCWPYNYLIHHHRQLFDFYPEHRAKKQIRSDAPGPNLNCEVNQPKEYDPDLTLQDVDVQLAFLSKFMKGCAMEFYRQRESDPTQDHDIRRVISSQMNQILRGCVIILIGFKKGSPRTSTEACKPGVFTSLEPTYRSFAEKMGAIVTEDTSHSRVTHCVMFNDSEDQAAVLKSCPDAHVVKAPWLHGSFHLNMRLPERIFDCRGETGIAYECGIGLNHTFFRIRDVIRDYGITKDPALVSWLPSCVVKRQILMDKAEETSIQLRAQRRQQAAQKNKIPPRENQVIAQGKRGREGNQSRASTEVPQAKRHKIHAPSSEYQVTMSGHREFSGYS